MDLTSVFTPAVLALQPVIFAISFAIVLAATQAGRPSRWSYLAAIGIGLMVGAAFGVASFGLTQQALAAALFGAALGVGTQTASRRKAEDVVVDGYAQIAEKKVPRASQQ